MKVDKSENPVGDLKEENTDVDEEQAATEEKEKKVENEKLVVLLSGLDNTERKQQLPPGCRRVKSSPLVVSRSA